MHLKRLELHSFKTFADRTDLEFGPGITAVVGPNGSGKTNIFDAIRWVLGETSWRALRGSRMDDVIFAGAADRRAHGLAQVHLTIDNESGTLPVEFAEVTVTRRATRAGEGEYFLNTMPCRLRDIQMLFLGTGLGGRSYAMIGQGEVDAVLDASPEERRALLEEAAGLARYKRRLREAERRLLRAQQNLERITDILRELDAQRASLASQASAAQRYREYEERARRTELHIRVEETRRLRVALRRVASQHEGVSQRRREATDAARAAERELVQSRQRLQEVLRAYDAAQGELVRAVASLSECVAAVQLIEERLRAAGERVESLRAEHARLEDDRLRAVRATEEMRGQHAALTSEAASLRDGCEQAEARCDAAQEALRAAGLAVERARADLAELQHARSQTTGELAALAERMAAVESQEQAARAQLERMREERAGIEARRAELELKVAAIAERLTAARTSVAALVADRDVLIAELQRVVAAEQALAIDHQAHLARLQLLEEAQAQLLGYEQGAREILLAGRAEPERFRGVRGALVDFLDTDRAHRAAVEAALGDRLFGLVADSLDDARTALEYLREQGTARATFLPLDANPDVGSATDHPDVDGVVGSAYDLVRCAPFVEPFVRSALRDVVVVADLDCALHLRDGGHRGQTVTLAGEILAADGALSGGRRTDNRPLGRPQEVASLRRWVADAASRAGELQGRREEISGQLGGLDAQIARVSEEVQAEEALLARARQEAERVADDLGRRPRIEDDLEAQRARLGTTLDQLRSQDERLRIDLAALDGELEQAVHAVEAARAGAQAADGARQGAIGDLTTLRIRVAEVEAAQRGLGLRLQEREADLLAVDARAAALRLEIAQLDRRVGELQSAHAEAHSRLETLRDADSRARDLIEMLAAERDGIESAIAEHEERAEAARIAVREQEEGVHRLEVRRAHVEAEIEAAQRRIADEHGISFEEADAGAPDRLDRDAMLGELEGLRGLIASLGQVNLRALDEYEQVSRRYGELRAHADDMVAAQDMLQDLIGRLDRILKRRFADTFEAVNVQFADCFRRLFDGGTASLKIVASEKGEDGVEILAQPPGKKVNSLGALSGGERVMVALALVFALLRVHPSPFCVFDEIEAALDDVNTRRVTELLRELARRTQVVIITHNKGTMEAADVLYGVTMHEPGVSSIVSVRMARRETAVRQPVAAR